MKIQGPKDTVESLASRTLSSTSTQLITMTILWLATTMRISVLMEDASLVLRLLFKKLVLRKLGKETITSHLWEVALDHKQTTSTVASLHLTSLPKALEEWQTIRNSLAFLKLLETMDINQSRANSVAHSQFLICTHITDKDLQQASWTMPTNSP